MRTKRLWIAFALAMVSWGAFAHVPSHLRPSNAPKPVSYRDVCSNSNSQIDQEINNVRARLLGGGDCWWDFNDGRYIVPKVDPSTGQREVSSIFAASVWLGGVDPAGNLKLACQDYRNDGRNDFWPGPLTEQGITERAICSNWDRHFRVTGDEIREHLRNLQEGNLSPDDIPRGVRGWPARGNIYFVDVWGFDLPYTPQGLAGFFDADGDGDYDPLKGDYPSIEIRGCPLNRYPDEMIFWAYNDQGGGAPHARTGGNAIQMEIQVQAFGYLTSDELNDMTFHRYKLINRATERIDSMFFAMWVDADLGCYLDDYIGCDTANSLMYIYNQDATDGQPGCNCDQGVATYCEKVPILGVDYFRGPLKPAVIPDWETGEPKDTLIEIGMSTFTYYNNGGVGPPPPGTDDPSLPNEYFNYITGSWRDGAPFTFGGNGKGGTIPVKYAFPDPPNAEAGWSMCTANLPFGDRRTIQASGPFTLQPGAVNELIIGVPWVADIDYPCPDIEQLLRADKLAQGLFDNCFELLDGPDAPLVDWVELNRQLIAVLSNDSLSNNFNERYSQIDFLAPDSLKNSSDPAVKDLAKYKFEGYLIYQLINPNVSTADYSDAEKARVVYQVDSKNGVGKIFNWVEVLNPNNGDKIYFPEQAVDGADEGIRHTFNIEQDQFASGNTRTLINHKKYYYSVVAYAYNNYDTFDPLKVPASGQQTSYLPGRRNIQIYTVIPRPIVDQALQTAYGDGPEITRLEGLGAGGNFLDLTDETRERIFQAGFDSTLTYKQGRGPINVTIFNPFEVRDGLFELALVDGNLNDTKLDDTAHWELRVLDNGGNVTETIFSERTIADLNEQIVAAYGFSITVAQTADVGDNANIAIQPPQIKGDASNGAIGAEIEYADPDQTWLTGFPDEDEGFFNFVRTNRLEVDERFDPTGALSSLGNGWFVPYVLANWRVSALPVGERMITPAWTERGAAQQGQLNNTAVGPTDKDRYEKLASIPNIDIVLTSDTSLWSRCVVVETASYYYTSPASEFPKDPTLMTESPPAGRQRLMFDVRYSPSVARHDANGDGKPDPDGSLDASGNPILGMGWFPGYAIDVETGRRLNIFFGENSVYSSTIDPTWTGRDMLWNPTSQIFRPFTFAPEYYDLILGGQHYVYVMNTTYDRCETLRGRFTPDGFTSQNAATRKPQQVARIAWAGMLQLNAGFEMRPLNDGLIPNDAIIKLRVDNPYGTWYDDNNTNPNVNLRYTAHPKYQFRIDGKGPRMLESNEVANALDSIKVVPNPYYGYSQYETTQFSNVVKITNLPGRCTVTIYSLDGKFIRQYKRDESYEPYNQISPELEWDLRNSKGIPVASGVYLINVNAPGLGERTVKWFGIARQFDPSGL